MAQFRDSSQDRQQNQAAEEDQELISAQQPVDQGLVDDTDDILDEIDSVLEENAEDYVRGFVQKGGQ
ncbi:ubiquitin-like protein Pup [Rothia sp. HC945]|uniref:ubiquitin-like protein Pup n=1 Tax=Rothia sp. HC945 TaxID=3171170 RepID=UPI00264F7474|nr:ubiquitin-like protein Pup [Kocuria sp.]MDN5617777.1 ubiquitin-like protein Pup [Kocuria sp.]MDN5653625.1 ubiquitin-like protein Pup [Kocuria sp.]